MVFNRGIGVNICCVLNILTPVWSNVPVMKFAKKSFERAPPPRLIPDRLFVRLSLLARVGTGLLRLVFPTDLRRRRLAARFLGLLRNKFLLPLGKNLPFLSLGNVRASFLPLATLLADFFFRVFLFGMIGNCRHAPIFMPTRRADTGDLRNCSMNA